MTMNLRPDFFSGASSSSCLCESSGGGCLSPAVLLDLHCAADLRGLAILLADLIGLASLLSSEIIFVICLRDAQGTGQGKLGNIVLVERADVLIVRLFGLRLRL